MQHPLQSLRSLRALGPRGALRMAAVLTGVLGLTLIALQVGPAVSAAPLRYAYQQGYYLDNGWLCYGWANGQYHCTQHWHRAANGTLISDHASWVPNGLSSGADPRPATTSTTSRAHVGRRAPIKTVTSHASAPAKTTTARAVVPAAPVATGSIADQIRAVFGPYGNQAVAVATCESGLNPTAANPHSTARGLFQFLSSTWAGTSYAGYSPFNAWANIQAAHQVFVRDGYSWHEWVCQP